MDDGARTRHILLGKQVLCQLSYVHIVPARRAGPPVVRSRPFSSSLSGRPEPSGCGTRSCATSRRPGSNRGPHPYQGCALPTELRRQAGDPGFGPGLQRSKGAWAAGYPNPHCGGSLGDEVHDRSSLRSLGSPRRPTCWPRHSSLWDHGLLVIRTRLPPTLREQLRNRQRAGPRSRTETRSLQGSDAAFALRPADRGTRPPVIRSPLRVRPPGLEPGHPCGHSHLKAARLPNSATGAGGTAVELPVGSRSHVRRRSPPGGVVSP